MEPLTEEERRAFLELYSYQDEIPAIPESVIEALLARGLLTRGDKGVLRFTKLGDKLYERLRPDEPYEGV
jgi:hypothetical protein